MVAVFPSTLEWKEAHEHQKYSQLVASALVGKRIGQHRLFLKPWQAELLIKTKDDEGVILLRASTMLNTLDEEHNITRVFATDENGHVIQDFPADRDVETVQYQTAHCDRNCMSGGYSFKAGTATAIKLTFQSSHRVVRLHCWSQCKAFPECGDPHVPCYNVFRPASTLINGVEEAFVSETSFHDACSICTRDSRVGKFLRPNFLSSVLAFCGMYLFDASGFEPLRQPNISVGEAGAIHFHVGRVEKIKPELQEGAGCRLLNMPIRGASWNPLPNGPINLHTVVEKIGNDKVFLVVEGITLSDIKTLSVDALLSKQLENFSCRNNFQVCFWSPNEIHSVLNYIDKACGYDTEDASHELSLRVTFPNIFNSTVKDVLDYLHAECAGRVVRHTGASMGYHLAESSAGYLPVSLCGSAQSLARDIPKIERVQKSMRQAGQYHHRDDYAVLRVIRPTKSEVSALASELEEFCYEGSKRAIYSSMHARQHGDARWGVALPRIQRILQKMTQSPLDATAEWQSAAVQTLNIYV
ncbi:hypothetical protein SEMRO_1971_G308610.1 [Seminavis robusta]|uniref:Uncharacterized protein n=1 Tax=Seminavis robusta TaxID=568900 RepID=A0A9N8HVE3_9STRA|nr:hypothetical protein SEMRO_1971_G308610.1 [Seminavis robusta]|eukprot:Sro1971_g308610.1 n/a (527) ;mRNA; r:15522-17102